MSIEKVSTNNYDRGRGRGRGSSFNLSSTSAITGRSSGLCSVHVMISSYMNGHWLLTC